MGLLGHLLGWPVTGPLFLARYSIGKARDVAVEEITDLDAVHERLMELQLRLESGEIDEKAYEEAEAELMARLRRARAWRRRLGRPVPGGPVTMGRSAPPGSSVDVDPDVD